MELLTIIFGVPLHILLVGRRCNPMETVQFIGACIGYTVSALTLLSLIIKPIRIKIVNRIKGINNTDSTAEALIRIEDKLKEQDEKIAKIAQGSQASLRNSILQLVDKCLSKENISSIEKMNLKDMYEAYHNLGGDTYATTRYELALQLPVEN